MRCLYRLAGATILCTGPFELTIQPESKEFLTPLREEETPTGDLTFCFCPVEALPLLPAGGHWHKDRYVTRTPQGLQTHCRLAPGKPPFACVSRSADGRTLECRYLTGMEHELCYSHNLCDLLSLELLLLDLEGLLLHASFIEWQGRGILFTAPSGTGKSTQAELWRCHENARIINGDRAGLRRSQDRWTAWGLPYAGSSRIYRNEAASVAAIVVLTQAPENTLGPLTPAQAFRHLYPETSIHRWDQQLLDRAVSMLTDLVSQVPVYMLSCRPDREAVTLLKTQLQKE